MMIWQKTISVKWHKVAYRLVLLIDIIKTWKSSNQKYIIWNEMVGRREQE